MVTETRDRAWSDLPIPPGELLEEELETIGMTQTQLATRTGRPLQVINEIIRGKKQITHDTAIELERVLGIPAHLWIGLEADYQLALARQREAEHLDAQRHWLNKFPVREMEKRGWIEKQSDPRDKVRELLRFFGVALFEALDQTVLGFRITSGSRVSPGALAAWLRRGELEARDVETRPYDREAFLTALEDIRPLTIEAPEAFVPRARELCAKSGVALVFIPELPKSAANGTAKWITPQKALIQLSLRYRTNDHLWFSFFHEACHVLRHRVKEVHIDGIDGPGNDELEANTLAEDLLIPTEAWNEFVERGEFTRKAVEVFGSDVGVAPGIVVGRLQNKRLAPWNSGLNQLKMSLRWVETEDD